MNVFPSLIIRFAWGRQPTKDLISCLVHYHLSAVLLTSCLIFLSFSCGNSISPSPESSSHSKNTILDDGPFSFSKATEQEFYDMVQKVFQHVNEPARSGQVHLPTH